MSLVYSLDGIFHNWEKYPIRGERMTTISVLCSAHQIGDVLRIACLGIARHAYTFQATDSNAIACQRSLRKNGSFACQLKRCLDIALYLEGLSFTILRPNS
jgi:hypothetical protein